MSLETNLTALANEIDSIGSAIKDKNSNFNATQPLSTWGEAISDIQAGGGSTVWIIPQPDESVVGQYYIALAYGTLGADEASSDIKIAYGNVETLNSLSTSAIGQRICWSDVALTQSVANFVNNHNIVGVWFGSLFNAASIGDYFLSSCFSFNQPLAIPSSVTSIGLYFLNNCCSFNQTLTIPNSVTNIGARFVNNCSAFNSPLTMPSSVTNLGAYFMITCYSFNQPITIPNSVTSIGAAFMQNCYSFNQTLTIPNSVTNIGDSFLAGCRAFNQPITIPNSVTSIGQDFLSSCFSFNQPLAIPNNLISIGQIFMQYCYSFNQPITIPNSVTSIGAAFMRTVRNMISTITYNASVYPTDASSITSDNPFPGYVIGIPIKGTSAAALKMALPNTSNRNLI